MVDEAACKSEGNPLEKDSLIIFNMSALAELSLDFLPLVLASGTSSSGTI
jgi:hypothetical protein